MRSPWPSPCFVLMSFWVPIWVSFHTHKCIFPTPGGYYLAMVFEGLGRELAVETEHIWGNPKYSEVDPLMAMWLTSPTHFNGTKLQGNNTTPVNMAYKHLTCVLHLGNCLVGFKQICPWRKLFHEMPTAEHVPPEGWLTCCSNTGTNESLHKNSSTHIHPAWKPKACRLTDPDSAN